MLLEEDNMKTDPKAVATTSKELTLCKDIVDETALFHANKALAAE